jgi:phage recombination protein Bet
MSTELQKANSGLLAFSDDQIALIRKQIAPKATPDELQLFLYVAKKTGLDPLTRQVYCIHRRAKVDGKWVERMTIQTGIDGYRVVAQRGGDYAGQTEPDYAYKNPGDKVPMCAKVSVLKFAPNGERYVAAVGVAFWDEYCPMTDEWVNDQKTGKQIPQGMWLKMPHGQLAKVAEAIALRKAFPQDLSAIYTTIEMEQADNDMAQASTEPVITQSADELRTEYLALLAEYETFVGKERASQMHPDNWTAEQTQKNLFLACDALRNKIEFQKQDKSKQSKK